MFGSMKLSHKLSLGFGLMIGLLLLSTGVGLYGLRGLNHNVKELSGNWLPSIREVAKLDKYAQGVRRVQLLYIVLDTQEERSKARKDIDERNAALQEAEGKYEPMISSP